ncbi:MAG TPA: LLM class flavin-dependent oxidoreductase [Streptosporangiaceae bacterium]|jgi:alkanesulfonate monooxygenase SsuD/methylene tetrahydromethanopterin reductase-like flavin-dependent oxidoreductase (luciferase family)
MPQLLLGVNVPVSAAPGADPVAAAVAAERLGYDFVSASDHPSGTEPSYETWTMLTWIAASTSRIQIASRVLSLPFRAPALVAKMAESLDRLSGGRLILGLGAGYADPELRGFGLPVPSAREKVDGLADALAVIRGLWSEPEFSYAGPVHHTEAARLEPKPGHPIPLWLGTFGDRALGVTGRLADGWIPTLGYAPLDKLPAMRARVLSAASDAGRDPGEITCALNVEVAVGLPEGSDPDLISGSPAQVAGRLLSLAELGFTAFNFMPSGPDAARQPQLLGEEVIPLLRTF